MKLFMRRRAGALLPWFALLLAPSASLRLDALRFPAPSVLRDAFAASALSALLLTAPANALTLEKAVGDVTEAAYPFLKAQKVETVRPFEERLVDTLLAAKPAKLAEAVNTGIDVFLALPPEKLTSLTEAVKTASASAKLSNECESIVPSPAPAELLDRFARSEAVAAADALKVKAFGDAAGPALKALPRGETICLPPVDALNKLALSQIEIGLSVDPVKVKAFDAASKAAGKTIPATQLLPLVGDAKKLPGIRTAQTGQELSDQKKLKAAVPVLEQTVRQIAKDL